MHDVPVGARGRRPALRPGRSPAPSGRLPRASEVMPAYVGCCPGAAADVLIFFASLFLFVDSSGRGLWASRHSWEPPWSLVGLFLGLRCAGLHRGIATLECSFYWVFVRPPLPSLPSSLALGGLTLVLFFLAAFVCCRDASSGLSCLFDPGCVGQPRLGMASSFVYSSPPSLRYHLGVWALYGNGL